MNKTFAFLLTMLIAAGTISAKAPIQSSTVRPICYDKILDFEQALPIPTGLPVSSSPVNIDQPVGEVFILGTSWYDIQHNSTCGRQVRLDSDGFAHIVWMNGLNSGAVDRHIYYQVVDTIGSLLFAGGVQVDQYPRAGYTDLELYTDNRAMPCFHQNIAGDDWHTALGFDYIPRSGAFSVIEPPHVYSPNDIRVCWPKVARSRDNGFHIISSEATGIAGSTQRQYYIRGEFDPMGYTINFPPSQTEVGLTTTISSTAAASPVSGRVAIAYLSPWATDILDTTQHDNNLIIVLSNDGLIWDWTDTINVTNWIPPDSSLLPDTLLANRDTLRCYAEISLLFDYNDVLHAFFTTEGYYHFEGTITWGNGFIWHWDEVSRGFTMVANGWFDNGFFNPGAWNTYTTRPSAAIDPATGDIYCMYQRYFQPIGPSMQYPYPYQEGDTSDFSATGWPNGEIWVTKSSNGGLTWAEGINVTHTPSPGALPGDCLSELTPGMYQEVVNGNLHIFYILDRDAGAVVQNEGTWTSNEVIYQKVPTDSIPGEPILPNFPMHVDSSGFVGINNPETGDRLPAEFELCRPSPNPFNPLTVLSFELRDASFVTLAVYDITGREVARLVDGFYSAGGHQVEWDASDMPSGVYFARLNAGGFSQTQKLLLLK